ncbi:hypothetical protein [Sandaracinus amylolyticus]|uniref:hypothetical protein n=1 Tax=Sandaracinus amylolyticus TaxID=927083 RepID=UPI001F29E0E8|nr:hypothetical protein [Sandaracinus amylolyticus]
MLVEEALDAGIPVLVIEVNGDLPNLSLSFPSRVPLARHAEDEPARGDADGLADPPVVDEAIALERSSPGWQTDSDSARAALARAISLVLRLAGLEGDPSRSCDQAFLSVLAERRVARGDAPPIEALVLEILEPPIASGRPPQRRPGREGLGPPGNCNADLRGKLLTGRGRRSVDLLRNRGCAGTTEYVREAAPTPESASPVDSAGHPGAGRKSTRTQRKVDRHEARRVTFRRCDACR